MNDKLCKYSTFFFITKNAFNPLGTMLIYICSHMPTAHRDAHIYMHALLTNAHCA